MRLLVAATFFALVLGGAPRSAHAARPTPHQLIEQMLAPLRAELAQLSATEAERASVRDVLARGEALAADLVAARHFGATARERSLNRRLELLARLLRGRIEAYRAESQAAERERLAVAAESERVLARATLERAAEHFTEADRAEITPSPALPAATEAP